MSPDETKLMQQLIDRMQRLEKRVNILDTHENGSYTNEQAQDAVGNILTDTATVDFTYNDIGNAITADVKDDSVTFAKMQNITTDSLIGRDTASTGDPENITLNATLSMDGSQHLQRAALTGDVTASAGSNATSIASNAVTTAKIADANVTLAKLANIATDSLIGRDTASSGVPENILLNTTLGMDGSGNLQRAALTGDVTASAGSNATTIANDAVTNAKAANMANATVKGRTTAGTGDPEDLTMAQLVTLIEAQALYLLLAGRSGGQQVVGVSGTGYAVDVYRNQSSANTDSPVMRVYQDNASDDQPALLVQQDAGQPGIRATADSAGTAPSWIQSLQTNTASTSRLQSLSDVADIRFESHGSTNASTRGGVALANVGELIFVSGDAFSLSVIPDIPVYFMNNTTIRMTIPAGGGLAVGLTSMNATQLGVKTGGATNDAAVGGVLYVDSSTRANGTTIETDLASYSVPASTLAVNNQNLEFHAWGTYTNNANTKTLKVYFGASSWSILGVGGSAVSWSARGRIVRTGATTQDVIIDLISTTAGGTVVTVSTAAETLSGAVVLKLTGTGGATNDIKQEGFVVKWADANT